MPRRHLTALAMVLALGACSRPTLEQQFVEDVARALGGPDRVRQVNVLVLEGRGTAANLGQDMTWEATGQSFNLSDARRIFDLSGPRMRVEQTRTPNFLYFQGPQPQRQVIGVDGDVAYAIAANGNSTRQSAASARDRRSEFYHHPLPLVRAMLDTRAGVSNVRDAEGGRTADVRIGETPFEVHVDQNGLLASVSSPGYHANLGDITLTTRFAEYQPVEGLTLPQRMTTLIDRHTTGDFQVARHIINAGNADAAAPAAVQSAAAPTPAAPVVESIQAAPGVWLLAGQSHHSALIEFADHLTLIEAPQSETRTLAVIAKARELVPGKPLTELVMSHHHFDHSGGLRAAVAEGLAVITHKANAAFVDEMVRRPHTRQPDALARSPRPLTLKTVDDAVSLQDASRTVVLYPLPGNPHGDTMVMAYLPRERVVIEVDAYSPGGTYHPYAANLLETIRARQLQVDRIVPLHGAIVPFADLVKAVSANQ